MKQAGRWLLFTAALSVLPSTALAQKPGGKPTTPPAGAAGGTAGGAAGAGEAVDLDSDAPPPDQPKTDTPPADTAGGGGICEIDPSACPKTADLKTEAKKVVKAEVYAVQQNPVLKYHRFEVRPFWGVTMNDQFVSHPGPGLDLNFYITNVLAIGLNGNFYSGLNVDSDFNFQNRRATRVAVPLTEYSWAAALNFTYVPIYGKFAGFGSFIFSYDIYATGGVGAISTRPIPVIDPDNRTFDFKPKVAFNLGLGLRIFLTKWLAANIEVRDYIYPEKLENLSIASGPQGQPTNPQSPSNPDTWYRDSVTITNNIQMNLGLSIFIPFSFDYRLAK